MDFDDVYKLYYRDVYYFLFSLSSDPQEAEELTQETFYRALQNINKLGWDAEELFEQAEDRLGLYDQVTYCGPYWIEE